MRILRNLIIILLLIGLMGICVVGLMIELPTIFNYHPTRVNNLGRSFIQVMRPGYGLLWMWFAMAMACILVLFMTVVRPRKQMKIEVQMGGGRVVIMDSAIKRYIRSALAELPGVTVRRIDLRETRLGVSTDLYADVKAQGNLPMLERQVIQRVRSALAEDLGITSIAEVHVFIRDFEVADRAPAHTTVRRPHAREPQPEETEPEPAHNIELKKPVSAEFTKPIASTGPFDQVPMPAKVSAAASAPAYSATIMEKPADIPKSAFQPYQPTADPESPAADSKYFTPVPAGMSTAPGAQVTDLGPREIYALGEATGENAFASQPVTEDAISSLPVDAVSADKPRKRGLFGLFGGSAQPMAEKSLDDAAANASCSATYDPDTATEKVEAVAETAEAGSQNPSTEDSPSTPATKDDNSPA